MEEAGQSSAGEQEDVGVWSSAGEEEMLDFSPREFASPPVGKKARKKREELARRRPPARGLDAKAKIEAKHVEAEHRHNLQLEAKAVVAANNAAKTQVASAVEAQHQAVSLNAKAQDEAMEAAAERRNAKLSSVAAKGGNESVKIGRAAAKLQEETQAKAAQMEAGEKAAAKRRAAKLDSVAARGATETNKVGKAAAKRQAKAAAKSAKLRADADAADARRAAKLSAIAAKGASESEKVERAAANWRSASPEVERPPTPTTVSAPRHLGRLPLGPPPSAAVVARDTSMLLSLLRGGAPNAEVLLATTAEDYRAIGRKYGIALPGEPSEAVARPLAPHPLLYL